MKKPSFLFSPAARACNVLQSLYALAFGTALFAAPNFLLGPNGLFPHTIWKQTSLESNDLDPITIFYERMVGAGMITLALGHLLLYEEEQWSTTGRALIRMGLVVSIAFLPICLHVVLDTSGTFQAKAHRAYGVIHLLIALRGLRLLKQFPTPTNLPHHSATTATPIQRLAVMLATFYAAIFCFARYLGGPSRFFFPQTPLENNAFDSIMVAAARMDGVALMPFAIGGWVDGKHAPILILKMACLFGVLALAIFFMAAHDTTGFFNTQGFAILTVAHVVWLIFTFHAAGAFKSVKTTQKTA